MFTLFSLKNSTEMTPEEAAPFLRYLECYASQKEGAWLSELPEWRKFRLFWCHSMTLENGVLGAFSPFFPRKIFLIKGPNPDTLEFWHESMTDIVIHELRHAWQFQKYGWGYFLCAIPGIRQLTLERDASRITEFAEKFCRDLAAQEAARHFEESRAKFMKRQG